MLNLIPYEKAAQLLVENIPPQKARRVPLSQALGHVMARDLETDQDLPPFNKSVVDGYAVRSCDVGNPPTTLQVVGEISAGRWPDFEVGTDETASITTGAPLPVGADAVVMVEESEALEASKVVLHAGARPGENVAPKGSEVSSGDVVLECGQQIDPAQIGVLATFGLTEVEVKDAPRVGILPTGSEIIGVSQTPEMGQIRNSNASMLAAQSQRLGISPIVYPVIGDNIEAIRSALETALDQVDLVVLTGGVSMGKHDYVPQAVRDVGAEVVFHKVAIKPGKPILFARCGKQLIFGLPGNPVSSFVTFELFVRPAIRSWMGHKEPFLETVTARLKSSLRHWSERDFYVPAQVMFESEKLQVDPIHTKGSADLVAFSRAECLILHPARSSEQKAGSLVKILLMKQQD